MITRWRCIKETHLGSAVRCPSDARQVIFLSTNRWAACASSQIHYSKMAWAWLSSVTWSRKTRRSKEMKNRIDVMHLIKAGYSYSYKTYKKVKQTKRQKQKFYLTTNRQTKQTRKRLNPQQAACLVCFDCKRTIQNYSFCLSCVMSITIYIGYYYYVIHIVKWLN